MNQELVHVQPGGGVAFHSAVGRVAIALSPFGAAAHIASQIGAYSVEIKRLSSVRDAVSNELRYRESVIVGQFEAQRRAASQIAISHEQFLAGWKSVIEGARDMRTPRQDREVFQGLIPTKSASFEIYHKQIGDQVVQFVSSLNFGPLDSRITTWRQLGQ